MNTLLKVWGLVPASQWIFFSCSAVAPQDTVPFLIPTKKDFTLLMNLCLSASGAAGRLETTLVCDFFFSCRNGFAFLKWLVIISIIISHKGSHWPHAFGKKKKSCISPIQRSAAWCVLVRASRGVSAYLVLLAAISRKDMHLGRGCVAFLRRRRSLLLLLVLLLCRYHLYITSPVLCACLARV